VVERGDQSATDTRYHHQQTPAPRPYHSPRPYSLLSSLPPPPDNAHARSTRSLSADPPGRKTVNHSRCLVSISENYAVSWPITKRASVATAYSPPSNLHTTWRRRSCGLDLCKIESWKIMQRCQYCS